MIIACPACATRYVVPDSAIGVEGRTVRCAKCRHSWFQDGPELAVPPTPFARAGAAPDTPPQPDTSPPTAPPVAEPAEPVAPFAEPEPSTAAPDDVASSLPDTGVADWDQQPARWSEPAADFSAPDPDPELAAEPVPEPAAKPDHEPPVSFAEDELPPPPPSAAPRSGDEPEADDDYSRFAHEPLFRPRRNPARMWTIAAVLFAVVTLGAVAATAWFGLPSWVPFAHPLFAEEQPGLKLDFPAKMQGQRPLSDQTWFFEANGTVTNVSQSARSVPTILAVLKDARGRIVFNAELHSPKRVLAPGESVSINEALVSVPKAAVKAEYGWKPGS